MKRLFLLTAVLFCIFLTAPAAVYASDDMGVVYAQVPGDWEDPHIWAWMDSEPWPNAFAGAEWPGVHMTEDVNNPGWYFIHVPTWVDTVIINGTVGGATEQTVNLSVESFPVWVTAETGGGEITYDKQTAGDIPIYVPPVNIVYAQIPNDWESPNIWAWMDSAPWPNAFAGAEWPGIPMEADENNFGWYFIHVPSWVDTVIINDGTQQTANLSIDKFPVWIMAGLGDDSEIFYEQLTEGDLIKPRSVIYLKIPEGLSQPYVWAWMDSEPWPNAFDEWPGEPMKEDPYNPGWFYINLPQWADTVIIHNEEINSGNVTVESYPVWIEVLSEEEINIEFGPLPIFTTLTAAPQETVFDEDTVFVTVRAMVPDTWLDPGVWAWGPKGDVFASWPGQAFDEKDGDWYVMQLPDWFESIIINAVGFQTADIDGIEPGRDIWIVVMGSENMTDNVQVTYESPGDDVVIPEATPTPPPVRLTPTPPPTPEPVVATVDESGIAGWIVVLISVVVGAGGGFMLFRKKKQQ